MKTDSIGFGTVAQPVSVGAAGYPAEMSPEELRALLWKNIQTLMERRYGGDNITRLGKDTGIKQGGAQRLKKQADVGVGILARVAEFFDVYPWQLTAPNLGESMRLSPAEIEAVRKLREPVQPKAAGLAVVSTTPKDEGDIASAKTGDAEVRAARTKAKHGRNKNR